MKVLAVIDDEEVIYRILFHLDLLSPGDGPCAPLRVALVPTGQDGRRLSERPPGVEPEGPPLGPFRLTRGAAAGKVPRRGQEVCPSFSGRGSHAGRQPG